MKAILFSWVILILIMSGCSPSADNPSRTTKNDSSDLLQKYLDVQTAENENLIRLLALKHGIVSESFILDIAKELNNDYANNLNKSPEEIIANAMARGGPIHADRAIQLSEKYNLSPSAVAGLLFDFELLQATWSKCN